MADDDFEWDSDNPTLVVSTQMAVAVFENARGEIAIRQQADRSWQDEDVWVTFGKDRALAVARAILEAAGVNPATAFRDTARDSDRAQTGNENRNITPAITAARDTGRDANATAPKDKTAAERQRRYRQRHAKRNAETSSTVTGNTNENVTPVTQFALLAAE